MPIREVTEGVALDNIVPYFQPILDLQNQRVWRYECLARLITQSDKTFLPSEFLYLLERNNHVHELTETMFCQSAKYFEEVNMPWNINLDATDLANNTLTQKLMAHLANYPNAHRVSVEVSASTAMKNLRQLETFLDRSLHSGLGVFIDNVGNSPGNIKTLLNLPIRGIKLAGGLIRHYGAHSEVREFVDNVLTLSHERSISVVAEHIETEAELEQVRQLPIRYAQGYLFSRPAPTPTRH
ncbi:EAL domain-containing protein [Alteromonas sp. ASW11-19]|uniref:EAL domain-containing protein n=1 Tax=Alteromonas salexigens TaxID=2982530 RepID=A0ABT2VNV0_9ALTE|nr:EAL domain-containing protein [Alteromonas salexigens]MCU7554552.1 EAL domain-containing protein [Alteromonas salexigens]